MSNSTEMHDEFRLAVAYLRAILNHHVATAGTILTEFSSYEAAVRGVTIVAALLVQDVPDVDGKLARIAEHAAMEDGTQWPG